MVPRSFSALLSPDHFLCTVPVLQVPCLDKGLKMTGYLKLIDFGIAKKLEEGKSRTFTMWLGSIAAKNTPERHEHTNGN